MPLRLDAKTILSMYNQSKMQTEESIDKDRMAELNRQIEEKRMADENAWRDKQYALSQLQYDTQRKSVEGEEALRRAQLSEIQRRSQVKGRAKDVFDSLTLKYSGRHPDDPVTYEDFDKILDHSRQMYGIEAQRQIAQASSATALAKQQMAWQLQQGEISRKQTAAGNQFLSSLNFNTDPINYTGGFGHRDYDKNLNEAMRRVSETASALNDIDKAATNPDYAKLGVNTYDLAAPGTLLQLDFLNTLVGPNGQPTESFTDATGYGNWLSGLGVGADQSKIGQLIYTVQKLKAQARKNPTVNNALIRRMNQGVAPAGK